MSKTRCRPVSPLLLLLLLQTPLLGHLDLLLGAMLPRLVPAVLLVRLPTLLLWVLLTKFLGLRPAALLGNIHTALVRFLPAVLDGSLLTLLDGLPPALLDILTFLVMGGMRGVRRMRRSGEFRGRSPSEGLASKARTSDCLACEGFTSSRSASDSLTSSSLAGNALASSSSAQDSLGSLAEEMVGGSLACKMFAQEVEVEEVETPLLSGLPDGGHSGVGTLLAQLGHLLRQLQQLGGGDVLESLGQDLLINFL